jgi:hypothetical protein
MGLSLWHLFKVRNKSLPLPLPPRLLVSHTTTKLARLVSSLTPRYCAVWIYQAGLLGTNSLMILNRPRFLAKYGLDDYHGAGNASPVKAQLVGLLHAVSFLKVSSL